MPRQLRTKILPSTSPLEQSGWHRRALRSNHRLTALVLDGYVSLLGDITYEAASKKPQQDTEREADDVSYPIRKIE